ncbi:Hypothetical predicted protein, partial [Mytilus galloprovincialis]
MKVKHFVSGEIIIRNKILKPQGKITHIKRKNSIDSQMAEVLEELTELEKQDCLEDVFDIEEALMNGEDIDVCKNDSHEKKNKEKANENDTVP